MAQKQTVLQIHQILGKHIVLAAMVWLGGDQLGSLRSRRSAGGKATTAQEGETQDCPNKVGNCGRPLSGFPIRSKAAVKGNLSKQTHKMSPLSTGDFTKSWPSRNAIRTSVSTAGHPQPSSASPGPLVKDT